MRLVVVVVVVVVVAVPFVVRSFCLYERLLLMFL